MSFILDALKKSEHERQRHQGPSLVDVPTRRAPSERPVWVIVLAALLVLNLIVFVVVLLRRHDEPAAAPAAPRPAAAAALEQTAPRPAPPPAPSAPTPWSPAGRDPAVRSLAEEAGVEPEDLSAAADPTLAAAAAVPAGAPIVSPIQGPRAAPVPTPPPRSRVEENLPTVNDVTAGGATQLPAMHLDIHVYATAPAERFVFINMKQYREGDTTAEGMTVEQIRRDGVVLNQQGLRFVLPRQ